MNATSDQPKTSIRLHVEYDGGGYSGWAAQKTPENVKTIQAEIESALSQMCGREMTIRYASRTDAGVHARDQVIAFEPSEKDISLIGYIRGLTTITSPSIVITKGAWVEAGWCPRRNARGKIYRYTYWNDAQPSSIDRDFSWWERTPMDLEAMNAAARYLMGSHDFESFRATGCNAAHATRHLYEVSLTQGERSRIHLTVMGNAFVKNMVRVIAGTLRDVGVGRTKVDEIPDILEAKDRAAAGMTAPPQGLCLEELIYDDRLPERKRGS